MMFKNAGAQGDLNGFLDGGSHMQGELRFDDTFRIDGRFTGTIVSEGDLIVGEGGDVEAEVQVRRVFVSGRLRGTVRASEGVEVTTAGKVTADLETPSLSIEDGAFFEGRCVMDRSSERGGAAADEARNVTRMPAAQAPTG